MVVLDTNTVSYIFNGGHRARHYAAMIRGQRAFISFQTLEELWFGAYSGGWGRRRMNELARHLEQYEVIWSSPELVNICARLRSESQAVGRALQRADAWIAATAILLDCPLMSHDGDFSDIAGLTVV